LLSGFIKLIDMAKATITFTLPEEQVEFHDAVHAGDYKAVLWDLNQKLRGKLKYDTTLDDSSATAYQDARDMLHELLNDYGVSID
jgi:hypothetical protein